MKKRIIAIGLVFMFILCGCNKGKDDTVTISQDEFDELMKKATQAQSNEEAADALEELEETTDTDIPIEELTGVEEKEESGNEESEDGTTLEHFPYPISDEITNSEIFDGKIQIYKDVFSLDYSMTPQDVYDILARSDRKDLYDLEIGKDSEGIPRDVKVLPIGRTENKLLDQDKGHFIFKRFEATEKIVFDDETVENTVKAKENMYYLVGLSDYPSYYTSKDDGLDRIPDWFYSGGISSSGRDLNDSKLSSEELIKKLEDAGYIECPEGIARDDSVETSKGMFKFTANISARNYFYVIKHKPEFDYCDLTYTRDKVEYVEHYSGIETYCEFKDKYNFIEARGIGSVELYYRGKQAIEKIEKKLKELGLESKISAEINNAHMND